VRAFVAGLQKYQIVAAYFSNMRTEGWFLLALRFFLLVAILL